ncbi:hypothetical protein CAOG_01541 [Capsaspora owczarzaki ATCC 30864]|uniref:MaoC-like domain-containing protein n=1 Tax=Capsaspora owczarzaki (strain ATCC 30864) TaxID=595528 RepID=A0A0D2X151_CAPO3|nr:hypothetical protein CAOG_01541 [Capsaspora owczarzaki ATCC 30864]KJE90199.1 hypothetical protein CAOG_001541 [Capsaspora owczarzaki ATCC 30864]|eukprot:XP_004364409.2 hypothetical protein CAOG_01541 [Capsaspora owczarzaki ATCC 30864]
MLTRSLLRQSSAWCARSAVALPSANAAVSSSSSVAAVAGASPSIGAGVRRLYSTTSAPSSALCRVGDKSTRDTVFTPEQVGQFSQLSQDLNPLHTDPEFAAKSRFGRCIVHGSYIVAALAGMIGTKYSGAIYMGQTIKFKKPLFVGTPCSLKLDVLKADRSSRVVIIRTYCEQDNIVLMDGEATIMLPKTAFE